MVQSPANNNPQGPSLGTTLFSVFTSFVNEGTECTLSSFIDYIKLNGQFAGVQAAVQGDLDRLE